MLQINSVSHDSPLGTWTQYDCAPRDLADVVESIWEVDGVVTHPRSRIFPNGRVDLIVNLGPPQEVVDGRDLTVFDWACVSGLQEVPLVIDSTRRTHLFGIRFHPTGAHACLAGASMSVRTRVVSLRELLGPSSIGFVDRLMKAPTFEDRARVACRWIEEQIACGPEALPHVAAIAARIEATRGRARVSDLRRTAFVSTRRLNTDFLEQVGTLPKTFARLARFRHALARLQAGRGSLTEVALRCGYYDHSHMTLDFREFAGLTPSEFLIASYPDGTSATSS